jgi:hypothetical protein
VLYCNSNNDLGPKQYDDIIHCYPPTASPVILDVHITRDLHYCAHGIAILGDSRSISSQEPAPTCTKLITRTCVTYIKISRDIAHNIYSIENLLKHQIRVAPLSPSYTNGPQGFRIGDTSVWKLIGIWLRFSTELLLSCTAFDAVTGWKCSWSTLKGHAVVVYVIFVFLKQ